MDSPCPNGSSILNCTCGGVRRVSIDTVAELELERKDLIERLKQERHVLVERLDTNSSILRNMGITIDDH